MKTNQKLIALTLCAGFTAFAVAEENPELAVQGTEEVSTFPMDVAPTQLTPEEEKQAEKVLNEACSIYNEILNEDDEGKAEYLQSNLVFVKDRIEKTAKELDVKKGELDVLNGKVMAAYDKIKALDADGAVKAKKRIQLVDEFRNKKETLTFRISMLENHLKALKSRQSSMKGELLNLGSVVEKEQTRGEKADQVLEGVKGELLKKEQEDREKEINSRFEKYR